MTHGIRQKLGRCVFYSAPNPALVDLDHLEKCLLRETFRKDRGQTFQVHDSDKE